MRSVAVVGSGMSGLVAAYELAKAGLRVCLYEKRDKVGGRINYTTVRDGAVELDLGFMVFNHIGSPNLVEFLYHLGVEMEVSDMSYSMSLSKESGCEWGTRNGLSSVFAQKTNMFKPTFWKIFRELTKFKDDVLMYLDELEKNPKMDNSETLESFVKTRGYSNLFKTFYLIPICSSIWPHCSQQVMDIPAISILSWFRNNQQMLQLSGGPQGLGVKGQSHSCVKKIVKELNDRGSQIKTLSEVYSVSSSDEGCTIYMADGSKEFYDGCILAIHASDALKLLGHEATPDEIRLLGAFQYANSDIFLHQDKDLMPQNPTAWSACNFLETLDRHFSLTYWLNAMQPMQSTKEGNEAFFVTINPHEDPKNVLLKWSARHPIPSTAAIKALTEMKTIQGQRGIWFCNGYQGWGNYEDELKAGLGAAKDVLGRNYNFLQNPEPMVTSWRELAARFVTIRFFQQFITTGDFIILEDGGQVLNFHGTNMKKPAPKVVIRVHSPQFYSKVCLEADLGLADAYINEYFSLVDKNEGLYNLFRLFIANIDPATSSSGNKKRNNWWSPRLLTSSLASVKYVYRHFSRHNSVTQARRNISRHYDVSSQVFSLFLGETMSYSCAMFQSANEGLREAQLRKVSTLIEKARIEESHEVLDIGFGWGTFAIEVVKRTGCKYTGISLSQEQLKFAEKMVKESGFQDRIKFLFCDYRELPQHQKYDRIISCEMIEHVGHEYMEDFFRCCDSALTDNGLLILQFSSFPDDTYDENRRCPGFIKEYIFPGGCIPSLRSVTTAMSIASTLCVEHVENIGMHYSPTLRCWRQNFLDQQSVIKSLGYDDKFIRTWEYYFDYCAAGFHSRIIHDYQVVFSRSGIAASCNNTFPAKAEKE